MRVWHVGLWELWGVKETICRPFPLQCVRGWEPASLIFGSPYRMLPEVLSVKSVFLSGISQPTQGFQVTYHIPTVIKQNEEQIETLKQLIQMAGSGILFQVGQHSSQNCLRENISNVDWNSMDFPGSCGCMTHFLRFTDFYLSLVPLCAQITLGKLYRILFLSRGETFVFICDQLCSLLQAQDVQKAYLVIVQQRISE